jgi:hypothetical protein
MGIKGLWKARQSKIAKESKQDRFMRRYINFTWMVSASIPIVYSIWQNYLRHK